MSKYLPEGKLINTKENISALKSPDTIRDAFKQGMILEGRVMLCDNEHNLHVDLGCMAGIIPREEGALGISEGTTRDIALISKVNKPVCFVITDFGFDEYGEIFAILSRKKVQEMCMEDYISALETGDIIDAKICHMEPFGVFADIGAGINALLPIDSISVSRIPHPNVRFTPNQDIRAIVKSRDELGRIVLTHKELLGTWEENAKKFSVGETVPGIVRSTEKYGVFVELTPNLAGLAEVSESILPGQNTAVYIKSIIPERMKIKLIIVDCFDAAYPVQKLHYFINDSHISYWKYSPMSSEKVIESFF
ncbi:MAG: S1 RNA-binding domain-containing protein [Ruminococcaceae bacterium]|nr:S1 RNA-binding domain-containing protein [Oscillospiraceae bacterium]